MTDNPGSKPSSQPTQPQGESKKATQAETLYGFAGTVAFFTLLSRILGMVRDLVIAHKFGAGGATDAWVQAFRIPNALRRLTAEGSMTIAFVPTYVQARNESGRDIARLFAKRVLGWVLGLTLVLAVLGMAFNQQLTQLFSPGFVDDPDKFALTAQLLRWCFPYLVMVSVVAWAMGVLNSEGLFAAPAAAPIFLNVGIILMVVGLSWVFTTPILAVAAGVLAGGVAQVVLQMPSLGKVGVGMMPQFRGSGGGEVDPYLRRLWRLLLPSLFGVAVYEINIIVLGVIASYLPTGQIFQYNNATRLTELVMGLFTFAFTTAGLPALSEHQSRKDWEKMRQTLSLTISATGYTIFPAMAGLMVAAQPVVAMLYLHGAFAYPDVLSTAMALQALTLGMPAVAGVRVMVPVYYAFGDSRTPVVVSALTLLVTGGLGWQFSQWWQVQGLALGLSAGTWFQCTLLGMGLYTKAKPLGRWFPWRQLLLQLVLAVLMAVAVFSVLDLGHWERGSFSLANWAVLLLIVLGGTFLYGIATFAAGEPEAKNWLRLINGVLRRLGVGKS